MILLWPCSPKELRQAEHTFITKPFCLTKRWAARWARRLSASKTHPSLTSTLRWGLISYNPKEFGCGFPNKTKSMAPKISELLANIVSNIQSKMLESCGWVLIRDNPCRKRKACLSQKGYFETFDYVRLAQLELIAAHLRQFSISGDCAELGVYKGYFAQKVHEFLPEKDLILFDTFEGFDNRDIDVENIVSPASAQDSFNTTSSEFVMSLFKNPKKIQIRKGYFPETAKNSDGPFCFVSLDVDLYQPTLEGLKFFYPRITKGGFMLIHDYNNSRYPAVSKAVHEFLPDGVGFVPIPDKNGSVLILKN